MSSIAGQREMKIARDMLRDHTRKNNNEAYFNKNRWNNLDIMSRLEYD